MNVNAILAGLQQFSPDRIMTAAGFLLVLLVAPCDVARRQTQAGKAQHRPLEDRRRPSRRRRPRDEGPLRSLAPRPARG